MKPWEVLIAEVQAMIDARKAQLSAMRKGDRVMWEYRIHNAENHLNEARGYVRDNTNPACPCSFAAQELKQKLYIWKD